jgi:hypothetical protein
MNKILIKIINREKSLLNGDEERVKISHPLRLVICSPKLINKYNAVSNNLVGLLNKMYELERKINEIRNRFYIFIYMYFFLFNHSSLSIFYSVNSLHSYNKSISSQLFFDMISHRSVYSNPQYSIREDEKKNSNQQLGGKYTVSKKDNSPFYLTVMSTGNAYLQESEKKRTQVLSKASSEDARNMLNSMIVAPQSSGRAQALNPLRATPQNIAGAISWGSSKGRNSVPPVSIPAFPLYTTPRDSSLSSLSSKKK